MGAQGPWGEAEATRQEEPGALSFEQAFASLQRVIEELRGDSLTLDRSLALYERGNALAERCNLLLTAAELRVTQSGAGGRERAARESFLAEEW